MLRRTERRPFIRGLRAAAVSVSIALMGMAGPAPALAETQSVRSEIQLQEYRGFDDVSSDEWYVTGGFLDYVVDNGLLVGYDGEAFGPHDEIRRGQIAVILHRMAGEPEADSAGFDDVDYGQYYGPAIRWARATGVVNGDAGTNNFGPDRNVTRQEFAQMLANYAENIGGLDVSSDGAGLDGINGAGEVSGWARPAMGWAVDNGLISGVERSDGTSWVEPHSATLRCQAAKMITVLHRDVLGLGPSGPDDSLDEPAGIEYDDKVVDGGGYIRASADGTEVTMPADAAEDIAVGDIVLFDQTLDNPGGLAVKVTDIDTTGSTTTVSGELPRLTEIYDEYDVEETAYIDPANFQPAPGITVLADEPIGTLAGDEHYGKSIPLDLGTIDLEEYGSISGKLTLKPGVIFKANIFDEIKLGVIGTADFKGEVDVQALPSDLRHIEIGQAPILGIKDWGAVVVFYLNMDLSGNLTVTTGIKYEASISSEHGPDTYVKPTGTTLSAQVDAEIGLEANAAFKLFGWSLGETGLEAGLHGTASTIDRPNSALVCTDFSSYLFATFSWDVLEGIDLKDIAHLDGEKEIFNRDNSPLKAEVHFENGKRVDACTWKEGSDEEGSDPDSPGGGTGIIDPDYDGIPMPDEGYGFEPQWTRDEEGRAALVEPFYVDAGQSITIKAPADKNCSAMFGIDDGNSLIRRTETLRSGTSFSYVYQGSSMFTGGGHDGDSTTVEVLVGRLKVWYMYGWGPWNNGIREYVVPIVTFGECEQFDYPVELSATTITLKVGQSFELAATQTVNDIYSALGTEYDGTDRWAIKRAEGDSVLTTNLEENKWLITAEKAGTTTLNICYGHKALTTRSGFNRQCKVIVTE
ncbi:S-layer homology domain-containing protein [Collinsella tanakaei]|uniref:S-layer homology domain-containing protein n=1 Tax=Collinsella tanakaei TaxID=626935 RepID=UPI00195634AE|nr:S-layer homology domain-containing protein [Collinsella tanakaei]MBM6756945.1 S-layer homology domain-containing protein [Collinsella tanakaei]